jgi:hypothetical protein
MPFAGGRDLEPGEQLHLTAPASFRGAWSATARSTFSLASSRRRLAAFEAWEIGAREAGFSPGEPETILGLTDTRLVAWKPSFFLHHATELTASIPLARLYGVGVIRHGLVTGVSFVTEAGAIIEFEAIRGRRLRRLAEATSAAIASRR